MTDSIEQWASELAHSSASDVLRSVFERFGAAAPLACSLSVEDTVLVHLASQVGASMGLRPRVFLLDTGRLHEETLSFAERVRVRYDVALDVYVPQAQLVESLLKKQGLLGFRHSVEQRKECCHARKVEPLRRALDGAPAWVTGLRRDQAQTRARIAVIERDESNGGIIKVNPLASWTEDAVWAFAKEHGVATHPLHARGFRSIGCAPCTRAVADGEDVRAGRWWWEDAAHKECGLHGGSAS